MAKGVWGIDVSRFSVKAVRLEETREGIRLTDVDVIPYKATGRLEEADLEGRIVEALKDLKFSRKIGSERVSISLPTHSSFNRLVRLPPVEDVDKAIRYEAQSQIPFSLDQVVWGYQIIEREYSPGEEKEVILIALKRDIVDNFLRTIEEVGLNIDTIQLSPVALYNFLSSDQDVSKAMIVLEMGADNSSLIVIEENRFWVRNIPISGNDITKALVEGFKLPQDKAEALKINALQSPHVEKVYQAIVPVYKNIVSEIHRSLGYYKSMSKQAKFDRILLLGNGTKSLNFQRFMGQALQIQANRIQKLNTISLAGSVDPRVLNANLQSLGTALGLAMQGLGRTRNQVNLVPGDFVKKRAVKRKYPVIAASIAVLFILVFAMMFRLGGRIDELAVTAGKLRVTESEMNKVVDEFNAVNKLESLAEGETLLSNLANEKTPVRDVMEVLLKNFPINFDENLDDKDKLWLLDTQTHMVELSEHVGKSNDKRKPLTSSRLFKCEMRVAITLRLVKKITETTGRERSADDARNVVKKQLFGESFDAFHKSLADAGLKAGKDPVVASEVKLDRLIRPDKKNKTPPDAPRYWMVAITFEFEPGAEAAAASEAAPVNGEEKRDK